MFADSMNSPVTKDFGPLLLPLRARDDLIEVVLSKVDWWVELCARWEKALPTKCLTWVESCTPRWQPDIRR